MVFSMNTDFSSKLHLQYFKDILLINYSPTFKLYLTVDFFKKEDFYIIKAKKMLISICSTNDNLDEAKKEFEEVINIILLDEVERGSIFKYFDYLGIEKKNEKNIIKQKVEELKNFKNKNELLINGDANNLNIEMFNNNSSFLSYSWINN